MKGGGDGDLFKGADGDFDETATGGGESGERNDSAKVRFVAKTIAELKGITEEELAKITLENGKRFFGIE